MNFLLKNNSGFSLTEIILAMAIFALMAATLTELALGSFNAHLRTIDHVKAVALTKEGMEGLFAIRSSSWNKFIYQKSAVIENSQHWDFAGEGSSEQIDDYTRIIEFSPVYRDENGALLGSGQSGGHEDVLSRYVKITISWPVDENKISSLETKTLMSAWQLDYFEQSDWSGGEGQEIWQSEDKFFDKDENIDYTVSGVIQLEEIATSSFATSSYIISSAFNANKRAKFVAIIWQENIPESCSECMVKLQIKTADNNDGQPGQWSSTWCGPEGEDGDSNDYFTVATGELINMDHNGKQWIKYKVILNGSNEETPQVSNIKIYFQ